jgi:hypothetical protein
MASVPASRALLLRMTIVGVIGFLVSLIVAHGRSSPYNNYVLLADALLHGHLWIDWPGEYIDAALSPDGHRYVIEYPIPAVLMMPLVALFGKTANQTFVACVLAGVACAAAWRTARNLGASERAAGWLTLFMLAGTDLLWCAMLGDVWFMAHVACATFLLLMLCELSGPARPWLVTVWFVLACGSRFSVVTAAPVVMYWLAFGFAQPRLALRRLIPAVAVIVPCALLLVAYNEARWHVPWDEGYTIWFHADQAGSATGSPFAFANLPMQLRSFFVIGPTFKSQFPYAIPELWGQALTWTSPALLLAFFARRPSALIVSVWAATLLTAAPSFIYYVNGYAQFGMRHALDFEPFLFVLMVLAMRNGLRLFWSLLIAYSASAGLWGTWYWNTFYRNPS